MIIFELVGLFMTIFGVVNFFKSRIMKDKSIKSFKAQVVDEVEDELYDNTGGLKTRFFKVFEYENDGEKIIVRSRRPMRRISDTVGQNVTIFVDEKNRDAVEQKDVYRYSIVAAFTVLVGIILLFGGIYINLSMKGTII